MGSPFQLDRRGHHTVRRLDIGTSVASGYFDGFDDCRRCRTLEPHSRYQVLVSMLGPGKESSLQEQAESKTGAEVQLLQTGSVIPKMLNPVLSRATCDPFSNLALP